MRRGENVSYTAHSWIFITTFQQSPTLSFHIEKHLLNMVRTKSSLKSSYHVYFKVPHCCRLPLCIVTWEKNAAYLGWSCFIPSFSLYTVAQSMAVDTCTHWERCISLHAGRAVYIQLKQTPDTQYVFSTTQDHFSFCLTVAAELFPGDCTGTV